MNATATLIDKWTTDMGDMWVSVRRLLPEPPTDCEWYPEVTSEEPRDGPMQIRIRPMLRGIPGTILNPFPPGE